jgi:hypothetical protein
METGTLIFVLGCYRSGKTTLLKTIQHSPECEIFNESNRLAYKNYRIRSNRRIKSLVRKNTKNVVIFELVNDLQYADQFLGLYPQSKAIWLYRNYHGVIQAALERWGPLWRDIITGVVGKSSKYRYQRKLLMERMSPETLDTIRRYWREDISPADGAALLWYARNAIYFDLQFERDRRVLMVKYEDLLLKPEFHLKRILDFMSCHFDKSYPRFPYSLAATAPGEHALRPDIEILCGELMKRLDEQYTLQLSHTSMNEYKLSAPYSFGRGLPVS